MNNHSIFKLFLAFLLVLAVCIPINTAANAHPVTSGECTTPTSSTPSSNVDVDYLIIGAGGSGIQMALTLKKYGYSYAILEKQTVPGSFWTKFPRFRELVSVNKWTRAEKHALRFDWHSFLDAPLKMLDITEAYFPTGDEFQQYMSEVVRLADLNIEYGAEVDHIIPQTHKNENEGNGKPCVVVKGGIHRCANHRIFVGTGLQEKQEPLMKALGAVPYSQITRQMARRKRVCIFGNGNAGFETAQNLFDVADKVSIYGKKALRIAAVTKSVGDVRTKFLQVLENFHFKLKDTVDQADRHLQLNGLSEILNEEQLDLADRIIDASMIMQRDACEVTVVATGFESHVPGESLSTRFPATNDWYQSTSNSRVHYIGWLMHEQDFRRSSSGFLAGYRYLIRNLVHHIREEDYDIEYPRLTLTKEQVVKHVLHRLDVTSDLIIFQDGIVLRDAIVPSPDEPGMYHYYEGANYQFHEDVTLSTDVIFVYFRWGDIRRAQDVFENINRFTDTKALRNGHIHPAIQVNSMIRELEEDIAVDFGGYFHTEVINATIHAALDGDMTSFTPLVVKKKPYVRTVVNMTGSTGSNFDKHASGRGEGGYDVYPPSFVASIVKSILGGYAEEDMQALTEAAKSWVPYMFRS